MSNSKAIQPVGGGIFKSIIRAALWSFVISLVLVLVFAIIVKLTDIGEGAIAITNQVIKIISVFFGVLFAVKERAGWFSIGLFGGVLYAVISFLVFSLIGSTFNWSGFGIDVGVSAATGILSALIAAGKK